VSKNEWQQIKAGKIMNIGENGLYYYKPRQENSYAFSRLEIKKQLRIEYQHLFDKK